MARVTLKDVAKRFGEVVAIAGLDLEVREGEFLTLLGPSGCGKTTALRLVAGFTEPTSGQILIDGQDVTPVPPQNRAIGMVFQDYALFPHLTIGENIAFGLRQRRFPASVRQARVTELLNLVKLPGSENRHPGELSGGQQQRIALARAIAYAPRLLLMDEPLGALDLKLREAMQTEIRRIQRELKITTVYVTHDQTEAMTLSDRIAVMSLGRLVQLGTPDDIYNRPRTKFVSDFIGKINFMPARVIGPDGAWGVVEVADERLRIPRENLPEAGRDVTLAVRPERLKLVKPGAPTSGNVLPGVVTGRIFLGNLVHVTVEVGQHFSLTVELGGGEQVVGTGDPVQVTWAPGEGSVLDEPSAPREGV